MVYICTLTLCKLYPPKLKYNDNSVYYYTSNQQNEHQGRYPIPQPLPFSLGADSSVSSLQARYRVKSKLLLGFSSDYKKEITT